MYGLTFQRAASVLLENSENLSIVMDDSTSFVLKTISSAIAGIIALLLSLLAVKEEVRSIVFVSINDNSKCNIITLNIRRVASGQCLCSPASFSCSPESL
jgi:hypothetical protein